MTPENQNSPWLLFEAGALTKHIKGRACGLLLAGLNPASMVGPLAQFQHRIFIEKEFKSLLRDLNGKQSKPLQDQMLEDIFQKWWPDVEKEVKNAIKIPANTPNKTVKRDSQDVLEEILLKVRSVEQSVEELRRTGVEKKQTQPTYTDHCPSCGGSLKAALIPTQYSGDGDFIYEDGFRCTNSNCLKCFVFEQKGTKRSLSEIKPITGFCTPY